MSPTFEIVFSWDQPLAARKAAAFIASLSEALPAEKVSCLQVIRRVSSVLLEVEIDFGLFSPAGLQELEGRAARAGGRMVELMRLEEMAREQFKREFLQSQMGEPTRYEAFSEAAKAVEAHLATVQTSPRSAPGRPPPPSIDLPKIASESDSLPQRSATTPNLVSRTPVLRPTPPSVASVPRQPRYEVQLAVEFKTESAFVTEYASNLSKGGVFVRTSERPKANTYIALKLRLPDGRTLETSARVVHCFDHPELGGVGLAFEKRDPRFEEELSKYLRSLSGT